MSENIEEPQKIVKPLKYDENYYEHKNTEIVMEYVKDKDVKAKSGFLLGITFGIIVPVIMFFVSKVVYSSLLLSRFNNTIPTPQGQIIPNNMVTIVWAISMFAIMFLIAYAGVFAGIIYTIAVSQRRLAAWGLFILLIGPTITFLFLILVTGVI